MVYLKLPRDNMLSATEVRTIKLISGFDEQESHKKEKFLYVPLILKPGDLPKLLPLYIREKSKLLRLNICLF